MAHRELRSRRLLYALAICSLTVVQGARAQFPDFGNFGRAGAKGEPVTVEAEFTPATGQRPALVFVTAKIADGFHLYAIDQGKLADGGGPQVTRLKIDESDQVRLLGPFQSVEPPKSHIDELAWKGLELREHEGKVAWFAPVEIAEGVDIDSLTITGQLNGQACNANTCVDVTGLKFTASRGRGAELPPNVRYYPPGEAEGQATPLSPGHEPPGAISLEGAPAALQPRVTPEAPAGGGIEMMAPTDAGGDPVAAPAELGGASSSRGNSAPDALYDIDRIQLRESNEGSLVYYLLTAFLGGIILNVMPCVLPVIGLKLMSFIQQAGESRHRALVLNLWYSAGIVAVFLALAGVPIVASMAGNQFNWGDQFGSSAFTIALAAIVFAMALSLLGLWEIPIPGFVGSGVLMDAAHREGAPAAFLKGMLTTVLATPCTGPYMVAGITWALKQSPQVTLLVFLALGLGMASPYLLVGAFPGLIRFLPKPGVWMETFKKSMGLVLLATVVWLLSALDPSLLLPTFALHVCPDGGVLGVRPGAVEAAGGGTVGLPRDIPDSARTRPLGVLRVAVPEGDAPAVREASGRLCPEASRRRGKENRRGALQGSKCRPTQPVPGRACLQRRLRGR